MKMRKLNKVNTRKLLKALALSPEKMSPADVAKQELAVLRTRS
jgi:hypothetical protein